MILSNHRYLVYTINGASVIDGKDAFMYMHMVYQQMGVDFEEAKEQLISLFVCVEEDDLEAKKYLFEKNGIEYLGNISRLN